MPETLVAPAYLWVPERRGSYGDEAIDLMALAGRDLDGEQRLSVDAQLSFGPGGRWVAFETCRIEPRQNGKTGGELQTITFFDLFLMPPDEIVWTAHLFRTSRAAFIDAVQLIEGCGYLSKRVKKITYANGEESIELHHPDGRSASQGAKLSYLARSKGGGRGLGGKRAVMDEALFLLAEAMGALIPTLAARSVTGNPQINYAGSAGLKTSDHLRTLRVRGRAGGDPSLVYIEHCAPGSWTDPPCAQRQRCTHVVGVDGCALDDEAGWAQSNHALHRRISVEYIRSERRALPPEEFGRERLGWWDDPDDDVEQFLSAWLDCTDTASTATGRPVFALDASPGSRSAAIVAATRCPDGRPHLELVTHLPGVDWLPARCEVLKSEEPLAWILDPAGPAGALLPDLAEVGIEPHQMTARELGQACEGLTSAATTGDLAHLGDPILTGAISGAGRRDIGDGLWAWSRRKSGTDICPLVAVTEAHWLLATQPVAYDLLKSFY